MSSLKPLTLFDIRQITVSVKHCSAQQHRSKHVREVTTNGCQFIINSYENIQLNLHMCTHNKIYIYIILKT